MYRLERAVLGVFAHPDDEFAIAGILIQLQKAGHKVVLACATKGEVGTIRNEKKDKLRQMDIASIREIEYLEAMEILDIKNHYFLEQMDGDAINWDVEVIEKKLGGIIESEGITDIITFDEEGCNGHPDHKMISKITRDVAYKLDRNFLVITKFSEEFLKSKIWYLPKKMKNMLLRKGAINDNKVRQVLKLNRKALKRKIDVMKVYTSQFPDENNRYYSLPLIVWKVFGKYESYYIKDKDVVDIFGSLGCSFI